MEKKNTMNYLGSYVFIVLVFGVFISGFNMRNMVSFRTNKEVQTFYVPISKEPILSWMEIKEGLYPNVTAITSDVTIGSNLSLLIYFYDKSKLYDMIVNNCIATDTNNMQNAKNLFVLYDKEDTSNDLYGKKITWNRESNIEKFTALYYTNFTSFKFPEKDKIYLTCNIELCFGSCRHIMNEV